jgi:hypothetical protein
MEKLENETAETENNGEADEVDLAEQEFANYCEANGFDHDGDGMDDEDRESFLKIKRRFVKAVKEGRVIVDGTNLVYTVSKFSAKEAGQKITVRRPVGRDFLAMDGYKETQQMNKFQAFVSSFCGQEKSFVARLDIADRQFLQDIGTLFLGS